MIDRTYNRLKESIYRGRLRPGQRIVERKLAHRLGISRIPLRESLRRLEAEGLVRTIRNTATFVEDFAPADILEIYSMRVLLEPHAAYLAAPKADAGLINTLKRLCAQMTIHTLKGDIPRLDRTDYQFHRAIVAASGHKRLLHAYDSAHIQIVGPQTQYADLMAMPSDTSAQQHAEIIQTLEAHDAEAARRAAYEHVQRSRVGIEKLLRGNDQSAQPE